jgi:hypothetical protein
VRVSPVALFILPPLLFIIYIALRKNRASGEVENVILVLKGRVKLVNYLLLFFIPVIASIFYALSLSLAIRFPTNIFIYVITTPLGFVLFIVSVTKILLHR